MIACGIPYQLASFPRLAQLEMRLQQLAHQLTLHPFQLPFQVTMLHLARLLRTPEPADCRISLVRRGKGIHNRTGSALMGSRLSPQPCSRIPP